MTPHTPQANVGGRLWVNSTPSSSAPFALLLILVSIDMLPTLPVQENPGKAVFLPFRI
jgi:hypothetical protein